MLLAEMKIQIRGEYEEYVKLEDKLEDAIYKLESYARQLFSDNWAKNLKLEVSD